MRKSPYSTSLTLPAGIWSMCPAGSQVSVASAIYTQSPVGQPGAIPQRRLEQLVAIGVRRHVVLQRVDIEDLGLLGEGQAEQVRPGAFPLQQHVRRHPRVQAAQA